MAARLGFVIIALLVLGLMYTFRSQIKSTIKNLIPSGPVVVLKEPPVEDGVKILFLHHSTGLRVWDAGVPDLFEQVRETGKKYFIVEQKFPKIAMNYPYDYWNIWVNNQGTVPYMDDPTLEMITAKYDVVVWKHCFPVSSVKEDIGSPSPESPEMRMENYVLQYQALKKKMYEFPNKKFIVWTGAVRVKESTNEEDARRGRMFFEWVKNEWDESGDNIFIWDFYELETEGGIYMKEEYASGYQDSHPNKKFAQAAAKLFVQRTIDVIEGRGDSSPITGDHQFSN